MTSRVVRLIALVAIAAGLAVVPPADAVLPPDSGSEPPDGDAVTLVTGDRVVVQRASDGRWSVTVLSTSRR